MRRFDVELGAGDLGVLLTRTEEASLARGRPFDSYEPPASSTPQATHAECSRAVKAAPRVAWDKQPLVVAPAFDAIPDELTARWWHAWASNRDLEATPRYDRAAIDAGECGSLYLGFLPSLRERAAAAKAAVFDRVAGPPAALVPGGYRPAGAAPWYRSAAIPPEMLLGAQLAMFGVAEMSRILMLLLHRDDVPVAAAEVPAYRALLVPQLRSDDVQAIATLARTAESDRTRLICSALVLPSEEHTDLALTLTPQLYPHDDGLIVAAGVGMADAQARAELSRQCRPPQEGNWAEYPRPGGPLELALFPDRITIMRDWLRDATDTSLATAMAGFTYARLSGAAAVPVVLDTLARSKGQVAARGWLLEHPDVVASYDGPLDAQQSEALHRVAREMATDHPDFAPAHVAAREAVAAVRADAVVPVFGADGYPTWWEEALEEEAAREPVAGLMPAGPVSWLSGVPALRLGEERLNEADTVRVLTSAAATSEAADLRFPPLFKAVCRYAEDDDLDAVAQGLLDAWLAAGGAWAERGYFIAAGFLGGPGLVAALADKVRTWPGQSQHRRAVLGLDVLLSTGTLDGVAAVSSIASTVKFQALREAAGEALRRYADLADLSVDQLEDRVIPTCGFEPDGVQVLDFGPRQFQVTLAAGAVPRVRALDSDGRPTGKPRTSLPAPNTKDEAALAAAAKREFTALKKQVASTVKAQTARLSAAMVTGRWWSAEEIEKLYAEHPVMNPLIAPLVWHIAHDDVCTTARINEEREWVTTDDEPCTPHEDAEVRLAHPIDLTAEEVTAWRDYLADHDLVAPFDQVERATFALPEGQSDDVALAGLPGGTIEQAVLVGTLTKEGWLRGPVEDNGMIFTFDLDFPALGMHAEINVSGVTTGALHESWPQQVLGVRVIRWRGDGEVLSWLQVPPMVVSEVRRSLALVEQQMN